LKTITIKRFDQPDEVRTFIKGKFELVNICGMQLGRATYEPGWVWKQHVGKISGTELCEVEHLGIVLNGQATVLMRDGKKVVLKPGDIFYVPPGHDSWVVGDEKYTSLHLLGAAQYAQKK
jgi:quercetin dioxygenase-like cupin family protein